MAYIISKTDLRVEASMLYASKKRIHIMAAYDCFGRKWFYVQRGPKLIIFDISDRDPEPWQFMQHVRDGVHHYPSARLIVIVDRKRKLFRGWLKTGETGIAEVNVTLRTLYHLEKFNFSRLPLGDPSELTVSDTFSLFQSSN